MKSRFKITDTKIIWFSVLLIIIISIWGDASAAQSDPTEMNKYSVAILDSEGEATYREEAPDLSDFLSQKEAESRINKVEAIDAAAADELVGEASALLDMPLSFPISAEYISADFDYTAQYIVPAEKGAEIYAIADGVVVHAGFAGHYGRTVIVEHGEVYSMYFHCEDIAVDVGDRVVSGETIAFVGISGLTEFYALGYDLLDEVEALLAGLDG